LPQWLEHCKKLFCNALTIARWESVESRRSLTVPVRKRYCKFTGRGQLLPLWQKRGKFHRQFPGKNNQMNYKGVIIEESLENKDILNKISILATKKEIVTEKHKTPWIRQWTLHTVEIDLDSAEEIAREISKSLDSIHDWYADFKNDKSHYVVFRNKVFKIDLAKPKYRDAMEYGIKHGIPWYQLDFSPEVEEWKR
jgi:hypothetical protein